MRSRCELMFILKDLLTLSMGESCPTIELLAIHSQGKSSMKQIIQYILFGNRSCLERNGPRLFSSGVESIPGRQKIIGIERLEHDCWELRKSRVRFRHSVQTQKKSYLFSAPGWVVDSIKYPPFFTMARRFQRYTPTVRLLTNTNTKKQSVVLFSL